MMIGGLVLVSRIIVGPTVKVTGMVAWMVLSIQVFIDPITGDGVGELVPVLVGMPLVGVGEDVGTIFRFGTTLGTTPGVRPGAGEEAGTAGEEAGITSAGEVDGTAGVTEDGTAGEVVGITSAGEVGTAGEAVPMFGFIVAPKLGLDPVGIV